MIYEHLRAIQPPAAKVGIACIYCEHQQQYAQIPQNLLSSLWPHLGPKGEENAPSYLENLYRVHTANRTRPGLDQIQSVIQSAIKELEKGYIIIDGLDELSDAEHQVTFLESIEALLVASNAEVVKLQVLVTSRLEQRVLDATSIEIQATEDEIRSMVEKRVVPRSFGALSIRNKIKESEDLRNEILDQVVAKANGMFLIADLHMTSLRSITNVRDLRQALSQLPEKLDDYYERAWARIRNQEKHQVQIAFHAMSWLYLSKRQLHVDELCHALATRSGDKVFCTEGLTEITDIIEACLGLVVVETHSQVVQLMHSTVREFFQKHHNRLFKNSPAYLTRTCLTYLCLDVFKWKRPCQFLSLEDVDQRAKPGQKVVRRNILAYRLLDYPFLDYAAENWGYHAAGDHELSCFTAIFAFLISPLALINAHLARPQMFYLSKRLRRACDIHLLRPLSVTISFGLETSACLLVELNVPNGPEVQHVFHNIQIRESLLVGLLEAMENGQTSVVKALLEAGIEPPASGELPLTALDRTFAFPEDNCPKTALDKSVCYGHKEVANILLRRGVGGSVTNDTIEYAISAENLDVLRHSLSEAALNGEQCGRADAILHYAAKKGKVTVVNFSLSQFADVESKDDIYGTSALGLAVIHGQREVVQLLLDKGAKVSVEIPGNTLGESSSASTPIQEAAKSQKVFEDRMKCVGHYPVECSSAKTFDAVTHRFKKRLRTWLTAQPAPLDLLRNPGFLAAIREDSEHEKIIKLLLDHHADLSVLGENRESLLHLAVISKPRMRALLQHLSDHPDVDLDVDARDSQGRTPLHYAAVTCNADVMELLIQYGADALATDCSSVTLLHFAIHSSRCIKIAIKHGCVVDKAHALLGTPLEFADSFEDPNPHAIKVLERSLADRPKPEGLRPGAVQGHHSLLDADSKASEEITRWMVSKRNKHSVLCTRILKACLNESWQAGYVQALAKIEAETKRRGRSWVLVPDPPECSSSITQGDGMINVTAQGAPILEMVKQALGE